MCGFLICFREIYVISVTEVAKVIMILILISYSR